MRLLLDLAPNEACHATFVTKSAVGSYPTISPLPFFKGGILSAALSVKVKLKAYSARPLTGIFSEGARTFLYLIVLTMK